MVCGQHNDNVLLFRSVQILASAWPRAGVLKQTVGADAASHIAEEIKNTQTVIPTAMILTVLIDSAMGLGILVTLLFYMGPLEDILGSESTYPFIDVIYNATKSLPATSAFVSCASLNDW